MIYKHEHKNSMQSGHVARSLGKARPIGKGRAGHSRAEEETKEPVQKQDRNDGYR